MKFWKLDSCYRQDFSCGSRWKGISLLCTTLVHTLRQMLNNRKDGAPDVIPKSLANLSKSVPPSKHSLRISLAQPQPLVEKLNVSTSLYKSLRAGYKGNKEMRSIQRGLHTAPLTWRAWYMWGCCGQAVCGWRREKGMRRTPKMVELIAPPSSPRLYGLFGTRQGDGWKFGRGWCWGRREYTFSGRSVPTSSLSSRSNGYGSLPGGQPLACAL